MLTGTLSSSFFLFWSVFCLLLTMHAKAAQITELVYQGEARDKAGALAYTEEHVVSYSDGQISTSLTRYKAPDGALIATLRSDYSRSLVMPTYLFEDLRRDYREGLRWQDGGHVIFHQESGAPEKSSRLEKQDLIFSCQGWHYYLVDNLRLLEKERLTLNLILPSELRSLPFVLKKLESDSTSISAKLSLKHWLFGFFAPEMRLVYDKNKQRLLEFRGVSNILSQEGKRQEVTIHYSYAEG